MVQKLAVSELSLKKIKTDPKNLRRHPERNLAAIEASIKDHGQVEPLLVQAKTYKIIAGHGRLEAMQRLGFKTAQVVELACDDATAKLLGVRLNKTAELGEWDFQGLSELLASLAPEDQLRTGFADFEIEPLLHADWAPPIVDSKEFSRGEATTNTAAGDDEKTLTISLTPEQTKIFWKAQQVCEQSDPIAFLMAMCQSCLDDE